ncbi:hypothetical protein CONLIGDRAFT_116202 [Coniochaeta ligniaria NRRL 30616]|uniref:Rhodopsin domain-containing protein n=1 Tax=Coniochaeta ligniaria NRRL 30616 TaxID=1408157 RepID=A0A1J7J8S6_9PEZI|nr:hypothetical protein CONLIGDRAFT_116202 [Coniochaeta ligniaria NRRL 30616]
MDPGVQLVCAMWALTTLSLVLVGLRLYTRIYIVKFIGAEDHLYAWTGVFLLVYTCSLQVSCHYGLGKDFWTLAIEDSSEAIFFSYVANSFAITGNALAKLSMGLFLLRVVQLRWQKISLWALVIITAGTSSALTIMLWNQTTPIKASWDPLRTPGKWNIKIQPMSIGLGVWSSACDFFFAIFPWMFIWSLRMPRREKIMLAGGMSLGVIAGVCGIIRTVVLSRVDVMNYTINFVPYFVWAGAEIAVAMVCLGIPTLRPLYLKKRGMSIGYAGRDHSRADEVLPQFTMIDHKPPVFDASGRDSTSCHTDVEACRGGSGGGSGSGGENAPARPPSAHLRGEPSRYDSVDEIFSLYDPDQNQHPNQNTGVIWVKSEVQVSRKDADWPLKN